MCTVCSMEHSSGLLHFVSFHHRLWWWRPFSDAVIIVIIVILRELIIFAFKFVRRSNKHCSNKLYSVIGNYYLIEWFKSEHTWIYLLHVGVNITWCQKYRCCSRYLHFTTTKWKDSVETNWSLKNNKANFTRVFCLYFILIINKCN